MIDWLRALADRPIAEHEQRLAFALAAAIIVIAAGVLVLTRAGSAPPAPRPAVRISPAQSAAPLPTAPATPAASGNAPKPAAASRGATQDARVFLRGYLAYLYGHARAREIRGVGRRLLRRLERERPRVSPATRQRQPRVVKLVSRRLAGGRVAETATIADGGVADYPVTVVLERHRGRWQAVGLSGD